MPPPTLPHFLFPAANLHDPGTGTHIGGHGHGHQLPVLFPSENIPRMFSTPCLSFYGRKKPFDPTKQFVLHSLCSLDGPGTCTTHVSPQILRVEIYMH